MECEHLVKKTMHANVGTDLSILERRGASVFRRQLGVLQENDA